jgi:cytochrome b
VKTRVLIWDLPTRLFHWLFAASFVAAFTIAQVVDDEAQAFKLHMLLGGVMVLLVALRLVWGLVGSRHARLSSFAFGPKAVASYFGKALRGEETPHAGHNPGSSVAVMLMLGCAVGLGATGALRSVGGEVVEELHELLAYAMAATVAVHLAGVAWHTIRHRENIARSMIDGRKVADPGQAIRSSHPVVAGALVLAVGLWTALLVHGYDRRTERVTLPLGVSIGLGEGPHEPAAGRPRDHDD